jgi:hydrogenase maturation factor HypE
MDNFESKMLASLKCLQMSLEGFMKKVNQKNKEIFANETFDEIIQMNNKDSFEKLIDKILTLVKKLNHSAVTNNK